MGAGWEVSYTPGPSGEQWDLAVLQAAPGEESRAEHLALLLQSLGGYPVLMSDRCAGGGSLQPQHTESKTALWHE